MSIYRKIRNELDSNPTLYSKMTNAQVVAELLAKDKPANAVSLSGSELLDLTKRSEFVALTNAQQNQWLTICTMATINPGSFGILKTYFPNTTVTGARIGPAKLTTRAQQIGLSHVAKEDVRIARAQ